MPFVQGDFGADDAELRRRSICRTGNIYVPADRYAWLHLVLWTLHRRLGRERTGPLGVVEYVRELGRQLELLNISGREQSFVYQAYRKSISIYSPALLDGAIGDAVYYLRRHDTSFTLDVSRAHQQLIEDMMVARSEHEGLAILAVGGSVPKHLLCNSAIFARGATHAIYVNTSLEAEGSNAGAPPSEAISWGKLEPSGRAVKVHAEATLVLPILLAATYQVAQPELDASTP